MDKPSSDDRPGAAAHAAFEVFWADLDAGSLSRDEAMDGYTALMSIVASDPEGPRLPQESDLAILQNAPRDEVLQQLLPVGGWVVPDIDSPAGSIGRLSIELSELADIAHDFRHQIAVAGLKDPNDLVGHFLIIRTARGDTVVRDFATSVMLDDAFRNIALAWKGGPRGPVL